ncbi:MAG: hypothetical protein ACKV2T_28495 [Kofleriaceae bacterium]
MTDTPRKDTGSELEDDLGLDESMTSMRSMWREMRDEEPSDKGMAALLAAAHAKAEEMKPRRSWFAVLLDQLRRPPVLAMATVVVLIGGAVVISGREDMKATTDEVVASEPSPDPMADDSRAPVAAPGAASPALEDGIQKQRSNNVQSGEESAASTTADASKVTVPVRPRVTKPPAKSVAQGPREAKPTDMAFESAQPPPAEKKDEGERLSIASDSDMQPKGGSVGTGSMAPSAPSAPAPDIKRAPDNKPVSRTPLPSIEGEDRAERDASIAQLVKQCEAAAAKNDCAAVRTIAAKIAKQDPQTYKNKLQKNTNVARCLEPPAPMEAASEAAN